MMCSHDTGTGRRERSHRVLSLRKSTFHKGNGVLRMNAETSRGYVFFFSSRRRHTRLQGDWSSDVCSSDLALGKPRRTQRMAFGDQPAGRVDHPTTAVRGVVVVDQLRGLALVAQPQRLVQQQLDRKSTRLNSSHLVISYAVFCLKKKKTHELLFGRLTAVRLESRDAGELGSRCGSGGCSRLGWRDRSPVGRRVDLRDRLREHRCHREQLKPLM